MEYIIKCLDEDLTNENNKFILKELYKIMAAMPRKSATGFCTVVEKIFLNQNDSLQALVYSELLTICDRYNYEAFKDIVRSLLPQSVPIEI